MQTVFRERESKWNISIKFLKSSKNPAEDELERFVGRGHKENKVI